MSLVEACATFGLEGANTDESAVRAVLAEPFEVVEKVRA